MSSIDISFDIPDWVDVGLKSGDYIRHGGVIYKASGGVVHHLRGGQEIRPEWRNLSVGSFSFFAQGVVCLQLAQLSDAIQNLNGEVLKIADSIENMQKKINAIMIGDFVGVLENIRIEFDGREPDQARVHSLRARIIETSGKLVFLVKALDDKDFKVRSKECLTFCAMLLLSRQMILGLSLFLGDSATARRYGEMEHQDLVSVLDRWSAFIHDISSFTWVREEHRHAEAILSANLKHAKIASHEVSSLVDETGISSLKIHVF